jgi:hypothetical protein
MWLMRLSAFDADHDLRTFKCQVCGYTDSVVVKFQVAASVDAHRGVMVGHSVLREGSSGANSRRRSGPYGVPSEEKAWTCCRNPAALIGISSHGVVGKIDPASSPGPGSAIAGIVEHTQGTFCSASGAGYGARRRTASGAERTT